MPVTTDTVTVSDSISYGITGPGGWFGGSGSVTFSATDSLGHTVAINWTVGGSSGTCASAPCTQPLPEGAGSITYTGTCSGGQTVSGSDSYRLDLTPPSVNGSLSGGTAGSGGYYTAGPVTLTCTGSDVPSGLFGITYGSQIASGDGSHTLSCTAEDNGGNTTPYSTIVRIDSTPPSVALLCNGAPCGAGWYTGAVTLTAGATDATSGVASGSALVSADGGATWAASATLTDGTHSVQARASDNAGNSANASGSVQVDATPPATTFLCNGSTCGNGWYSGGVVVSLSASDATSGLIPGSNQISVDGGATWGGSASLTDGVHNVQGRARDAAGNLATTSWVVQIDSVAPSVNGTLSGGVMGGGGEYLSGPVTLTCTASDPLSGMASLTYSTRVATATGSTTLDCTATDNAGNHSSYSTTVFIDNTAPNGAFQYSGAYCPGGWYNSPVHVSLAGSDPQGGPVTTSFAVDGKDWSFDKVLNDGVYSLTGIVSDLAGNVIHLSDTLQVDTIPPISSFITKDQEWVGGKVSLEGQSVDWTSGIAKVELSLDNGKTWIPLGASPKWVYSWNTLDSQSPVADGPYTILARALDQACNQEHTAHVVVNVDNTPPTINLQGSLNIMGRTTTVISFDAGSGVDHGVLTISGNGIATRQIAFTGTTAQIAWDGLDGDGKTAPFGVFNIVVDVWDKVGNHGTTRGLWVRPAPVKPTAIPATAVPAIVPVIPIPATPEAGRQQTASAMRSGIPGGLLFLPAIAVFFWLLASGTAFSRDRRGAELRALSRSVNQYLAQSKTNSKGEDDD